MMRTWLWMLLLLGVAVALAVVAQDHAGNVVVMLPPYRIETSLAFAVTAIAVLFVILHVLLRLAGWTTGVGARVRNWREQRNLMREHGRLEHGWINLLQGQYVQAETDFDHVARRSASVGRQVLAKLSAAHAALSLRQPARVETSLNEARRLATGDPELMRAVACTAADLFLKLERPHDALEWMKTLHDGSSKPPHVQRLLLRVQIALRDWPAALKLARQLALQRSGEPGIADTLAHAAANSLRAAPDVEARRALWKMLKPAERTLPEVALAAADCFADHPEEVRGILQNALDVYPDSRLLAAYARCEPAEAPARIQRAEAWLARHPDNPALLRVLGDLCLRARLWGAAESYLQRSLQQRDDPRTHALLGTLYDHLGRGTEAIQHWRLATAGLIALRALDSTDALPAAETELDPMRLHAEVSDIAETGRQLSGPSETTNPGPSSALAAVQDDALPRAADGGGAGERSDADDMLELGAADLPPTHPEADIPDSGKDSRSAPAVSSGV